MPAKRRSSKASVPEAARSGRKSGSLTARAAKSPRARQASHASPTNGGKQSTMRGSKTVLRSKRAAKSPIVKNPISATALVAVAGGKPAAATGQVGAVWQAAGQGISITAHLGDGMVLLAFDLDSKLTTNLAGFAVRRVPPSGQAEYLLNRLSFTTKVTAATTPAQRKWTPSDQAPFQKFRWIDFPADTEP